MIQLKDETLVIREVVNSMDEIEIRKENNLKKFKIKFEVGSYNDMISWLNLKTKSNESKYPLIWLDSNYELEKNGIYLESEEMKFIISTLTDFNSSNLERALTTFKKVLYPTANLFIKAMSNNKVSINKEDIVIKKYYNFNTTEKDNNNDLWDSIVIKTGVKFNLKCI